MNMDEVILYVYVYFILIVLKFLNCMVYMDG